ncbi:hypothetical protein LINGRAHAP2_LOCUS17726 [Linum grandiflorum]
MVFGYSEAPYSIGLCIGCCNPLQQLFAVSPTCDSCHAVSGNLYVNGRLRSTIFTAKRIVLRI